VLGNAHLTNFFVNNENVSELELALKAYSQSERNLKEPNPDMYYNRATIYEYLERYSEAVKDYNLAHSIDPNLKGDYKSGHLIHFVIQAANFIQSRGKS
jgi:tetratricopeptide (TPR) repeat protein